MNENITILGIETSCDETAVAIVNSSKNILSNQVYSQITEHEEFKGVVPEIAARAHMLKLEKLIMKSLEETKLTFAEIDAISVTIGPGLIGGLIVGLLYAKAIAYSLEKPLIGINHLEAHALTARLTNDVEFPYLLLLVSGGHTQIIIVESLGKYKILGTTIDDAIGEAFDKVAKMLNLPYPGGPEVEKLALKGKNIIKFPVPLRGQANCNFSLSGLKTAVRNYLIGLNKISQDDVHNICCSFQHTILEIIKDRLKNAFKIFNEKFSHIANKQLVIAGGVASNKFLRENLTTYAHQKNYNLIFPPAKFCTDNAAMIAWVGIEKFKEKKFASINIAPRSKWSIEEV